MIQSNVVNVHRIVASQIMSLGLVILEYNDTLRAENGNAFKLSSF